MSNIKLFVDEVVWESRIIDMQEGVSKGGGLKGQHRRS